MHPVVFHLGHLAIPVFGLLAAAGVACALALSERTARLAGVDPERLASAGLFAVVMAYVLSRVLLALANLHTLRTDPMVLLRVPSLTPVALVLTVAATVLWLRARRVPVLPALDAWAPCVTLAWGFLAAGHAVEGSDPGMPVGWSWTPTGPAGAATLHPVAVYVCVAALLLTVLLYALRRRPLQPGTVAAGALAAAGVVQFAVTFVRRPGIMLFGLDATQWLALAMIAAAATLAAWAGAGARGRAPVG